MGVLEPIKAGLFAVAGAAIASAFYWLIIIPIERNNARRGYVVEARATAAEAKLLESQRQINAGQIVIASYQEIAKNDRARDAEAAASSEKRISDYEKLLQAAGRRCDLNADDIRMYESQ